MTNEEAIKIIRNEYLCVDKDCDIEKSCRKCPYAMPTKEPILEAYNMAIKALEQEPKTGHWSHDGSHWKNRFICSECGYKLFDEPTNYCPNCGAKMVEPQESEDKE